MKIDNGSTRAERNLVVLILQCAIGIGCLFLAKANFELPQKREPKYAVDTFFRCLQQSDAACLKGLMSPDESQHFTDDQWATFFKEIWSPMFKGNSAKGKLVYDESGARGAFLVGTQNFVLASGKSIYVGAIGQRTEDTAVIYPVFAALLFAMIQTFQRAPGELQSVYKLRALTLLRPRFEALAIRGAMIPKLEAEFVTWDAMLKKASDTAKGQKGAS
ncbi:MAG: hypothetical protein ABL949_15560 [Fimbriimonadaceae bacterium]